MRTQFIRLRPVLTAAVLLSAPSFGVHAQAYSYTIKTTMQSAMMSGVTMLANAVGDSSNGRLDIVQAMQPGPMSPGDYVLFSQGKMTFVRPAAREYSEVTPFQMASSATTMAGATIKLSNLKVSGEALGSDTALGQPTRHVRLTQEYTMGIDMMGMHQDAAIHSVTEYWYVDLPLMSNPFTSTPSVVPDSASANPLAELFTKTLETMKTLKPGFPIKQVLTSSTSAMGNSMEVTQTTEISDIKPTTLDRSKFAVPAGFTKTEFKAGVR